MLLGNQIATSSSLIAEFETIDCKECDNNKGKLIEEFIAYASKKTETDENSSSNKQLEYCSAHKDNIFQSSVRIQMRNLILNYIQ